MLKAMKVVFLVAALFTARVEAQEPERVHPPQEAAEDDATNPRLWYRLGIVEERAELFTHWERVHPHRILLGAKTPRVYERNTRSIDEVTYEVDGKSHSLPDYIERANVSGLMVLHDGEVRLEYYGKGLDARSRNHIWSATKSFTSTLVGMALFDGTLSSLDDTAEKWGFRVSCG